jgi:hypothetical protein
MLISLLPVPECILVIGVANSSQDFPAGWPKNLSPRENIRQKQLFGSTEKFCLKIKSIENVKKCLKMSS